MNPLRIRSRAMSACGALALLVSAAGAHASDRVMYLGAGWDDVNDKTGSPAVALMAGVAGEGWRPFDDGSGSIGARFRIRPQLTAEATFDGDVFVGAGLAFQLPVGSRSFVEASFQPGVQYLESDVFAPQFRSAIGIGFDLDSTTTLALIGNHKSNAKLGQDDSSSETILLRVGWRY